MIQEPSANFMGQRVIARLPQASPVDELNRGSGHFITITHRGLGYDLRGLAFLACLPAVEHYRLEPGRAT